MKWYNEQIMEDSISWNQGYANANATGGNNGFICGYAAKCSPGEFQQQQQPPVSSQIQHHLNQISMHMGMDDESAVYDSASMVDDLLMDSSTHHGGAGSFHSPSSSSASFRSASVSCGPESSAAAAHVLGVPASAAAVGFQYLEVSSQAPLPLPLAPYELQIGHYTGLSPATTPATGGSFRRYARHLRPRRLPKPEACGQRMFKTAMSVLAKMHVAMTYSRQYYYQQAASASASVAEAAPPSGNQLQHMISERKRREKLNDSFVALKAVLPPGSKKDKTSILIKAREYVKSLESKLSELKEKNRELEARLASRPAVAAKNNKDKTAAPTEASDETRREDLLEIEVTSGGAVAAEEGEETCTLNVDLRGSGGMSTTDVLLRTLQCLREKIGDGASLVAMSTSTGSGGRPPRANLTLQLKARHARLRKRLHDGR